MDTTFAVRSGSALNITSDATIRELEIESGARVQLNGHKLRIVSCRHRNGKGRDACGHRKGDWPGTVDYAGEGSTILWGGGGLRVIVR